MLKVQKYDELLSQEIIDAELRQKISSMIEATSKKDSEIKELKAQLRKENVT